jgi:predicted MPP superfamily phosphohydrolase
MTPKIYRTGGALTDDRVYIKRYARSGTGHSAARRSLEEKAQQYVRDMEYLLIIEPRQQGKTSLINYLMRHPALSNMLFVYVDASTLDCSTEMGWYSTLCTRLLRELEKHIGMDPCPTIPKNGADWHEFLCGLAQQAKDSRRRVVITLDEVGAANFSGATEFFSVLRAVFNSRGANPEFNELTFLLVGAFHPQDLIENENVSPFNIAEHIRLPDFTEEQVGELLARGNHPEDKIALLAERIHCWTAGQPYLTQLLCSYLGPDATPGCVDAGIERLRRNEKIHLPPLLKRIKKDDELYKYLDLVMRGTPIRFYPAEDRRQAQLELLGVLKADENGYCTIRNRIYSQALWSEKPIVFPKATAPESVTWLHLSDFHVGKDDYGQRRLFRAILDHIESRVKASTGPDMVFVTGDIANQGKPAEYKQFIDEFYQPLTEKVDEDCSRRILLVPGNHDLDRTKEKSIVAYGVLGRVPQFLDPTADGLNERLSLTKRFQAFVDNDRSYQTGDPHWLCSPQGALLYPLDIGNIGILGMNTAWLSCSDLDRHELFVGKDIVAEGLEQLEDCDVRIVLGHHPIDWFADEEANAIRALFGQHGVIYLHGHMHKGHSSYKEGAGNPFLTLQAGACFQAREDESWVNRLLWCTLDLGTGELSLEPLRWSRDYQEWVIDGDAFPRRYQQPTSIRWVLTAPPSRKTRNI